jgi:PAS domain S-box-containing protein
VSDNVSRDRAGLPSPSADWLAGGGDMVRLVQAVDWSRTPLGPLAGWPQSLRSALSICLGSRFPIVIYWGSEFVVFYNDAYAEILGKKHPWALGRPCREVWSEIWDVIEPMLDRVLTFGDATWSEDQLLMLERRGYPEECYFSFSFSPVRGANGRVDGIFTAVIENTRRVLGERRLRSLRDLGASLAEAKSAEDACSVAVRTLADSRTDVPFALLYLLDPQTRRGTLVASTGEADEMAAPISFDLDSPDDDTAWPLARVCRSGETVQVGAPSSSTLILPLATAGEPHCAGVIVVGVSPRRELDQEYRGFFELIARRVAAAVAEARAYEVERRRAEALAEIDRAKTAFFSNVSHEFRTPLTLMLGPLEDLKGELRSSGASLAQCQQIEVAHRNGLRLLKLVNTLLDFSRIEAGRVQAVYEPTNLATTTADLASVFRSAIEKAGLRLIVDCPSLSEQAYIDREMWEKIVLNLISNAFKFTFEGEIEVKLREANDHIELAVRDTGTGIPAHELPRLFERFHRVVGAHGRTHEGSGIGLALVQELVKLHGGSVSAESRYGKGSTLKVKIPRGRDHLPPEQIGAARTPSAALRSTDLVEEVLSWPPESGMDDEGVIEDVVLPRNAEASSVNRARILLADDNADMRDYVSRLLASSYDVEVVADGEEALAAIARRKPDLLLTDIMMPRLDGIELLARLRADPTTSTLPIILLSARAGEESRVEGIESGADDYLIKPFSARELLARVEAHVKMARLRDETAAALRESEARFRHMADHAPVMIWITEPDASCTFLSQSWYEFAGQKPETGLGFGWLDVVHPDDRQTARDTFLAASAKREPFRLEYRLRRKDGVYRWAIIAAAPRLDVSGTFLSYIGSVIDITERKQAEGAMQQLAAIVESSDDAIVGKDLKGIIKSWNRGAQELFGYEAAEIIGKPVTTLIPPERQHEETEILERITRGEKIDHFETVRLRKNGRDVHISLSVSPVKDTEGRVTGAAKIARDITERKKAENTQRLLVNELQHRVKNMLASVQAIVQQTLRQTKDPVRFVESFAGRIQSLARIHTMLSGSTWQGADLRDLIRDQLIDGAADETRIAAWGPPVSLEPQMSLHVALMVHELGTNAVKYGALSVPGGQVTIGWRVENRDLRMHWEERGGPPPRVPTAHGFGTTLIDQSAKAEGGQAHMLITAEGVIWDITMRLPRALAQTAISQARSDLASTPAHQQIKSPDKPVGKLSGKRFLVVEDEPLVALDISAGLQDAGADVVALTGSPSEALNVIESRPLDAALLDGNLRGRPVDAIAAMLTRRKVPFAFVSGYGRESLPRTFGTVAHLAKPFSQAQLLEVATQLSELPAAG